MRRHVHINVLGTIVKNKGILVQKDPTELNHQRQTSGIPGMNVLGAIPEIRELLRTKPKREIDGRHIIRTTLQR